MTRTLKTWLVSLALTAMAVWISIRWLDRPIALWTNGHLGQRSLPAVLTSSPVSSTSLLSACMFVICGIVATSKDRFSKFQTSASLCVISSVAAILVKDQLKFIFGRTWPETWSPGLDSLLRNGTYGFHFFHAGKAFESFPSGHATVAAAVLSIIWILYPKLRAPCALGILLVDVGLVALNIHFVSDVIAGTFVGNSTGLFIISLLRVSAANLAVQRDTLEKASYID
jgi:membrane-associated phospholipid phosphatase